MMKSVIDIHNIKKIFKSINFQVKKNCLLTFVKICHCRQIDPWIFVWQGFFLHF